MPNFRVTMEREAAPPARPRNPFLISDIFSERWQRTMLVREWEFEAADETEARDLLKQAQAADIETVRGFTLVSVQQLHIPTPAEPTKP